LESQQQPLPVIQQFVNQHNAKITGENPLVALPHMGTPHPQMAMANPSFGALHNNLASAQAQA